MSDKQNEKELSNKLLTNVEKKRKKDKNEIEEKSMAYDNKIHNKNVKLSN